MGCLVGWEPTTRKGDLGFRNPRGMLRRPSSLILPPDVAYLSQDMRHGAGIAERRPGAVRLLGIGAPALGSLAFDGTTGMYVTYADNAVYDLGTKWAIVVHAKTTGTPGGTQYLISRDVTPVSAGDKTFALSINSSLRLGFEMEDSAATSFPLTASAASVVTAATKFTALVYRDGATLAMHLNGSPTAALSRTDLVATNSNIAGAQPVLLAQNYDGSSRTGAFDGTIGFVAIFRDFASLAQLLKYTTFQTYPDPKDPRVALWSAFTYSIEQSGSFAYDLSTVANNGTITGSPTRAAAITEAPALKVQAAFPFSDPQTGVVKNVALVGGDLYHSTVRSA